MGFVLSITSFLHAADAKRILCFGDSITAGGKWVEIVGLDKSVETINAGRSGRKAAQAEKELAGYLAKHKDLDGIIMFLGVNDLPARDPRPGDVKVAACVANMSAAIDLALTHFQPNEIVLVAPSTVNPDTMSSINLKKGYHVTPPMLSKMKTDYKTLAEKKGVLFLSLLDVVSKENYKDGLHPNKAGDAEIAKAVSRFITSTLCAAEKSAESKFKPAPKGWPKEVNSIEYSASIDGTPQPMLMYEAKTKEKRPLLVGLHTWSSKYTQAGGETVYARWCMANDWHFIHPHFRGPNWTPDACGSEKVVQDIIDAVEYMKKNYNVDADRIYLIGASGGGHASILMAGRAPDIWAGVSAWVPISDIHAWWEQKNEKKSRYAIDIEKSVGGRPDQSEKAAKECVRRSPLTYLSKAAGVNLDINAGITDGHKGGSVPFTHSLYAFNQVVPAKDRIDLKVIEEFYENQELPSTLLKADIDPLYGKKEVIFRKVSHNTRVSIFKSGHDIIHHAALNWLAKQRRGTAANWTVAAEHNLKTDVSESASGK